MVRLAGGQSKYVQPVMVRATPVINAPVSNVQMPTSPGTAEVTSHTSSDSACAAADAAAAAVAAPVMWGLASTAPSKSSQLRSLIMEDGQPSCSPYAWNHKDSGCQHGANCIRCDSCSEGEQKLRKQQKLAKLRKAETTGAPAVNAPTSPASESVANTSAAALSRAGATRGAPAPGHKIIGPRWADIDSEEEPEDQRPVHQGQSLASRRINL